MLSPDQRRAARLFFLSCWLTLLLALVASPAWTQTYSTLHKFTGTPDGSEPEGGLVMDRQGNLYGTTFEGGELDGGYGNGTVFKLTPSSGGWTYNLLYAFTANTLQGPTDSLIFDASGNLYATASGGLERGAGGIFEITP